MQPKVYSTHFDEVEKVWSGSNSEINLDKHINAGAVLLEKLKEDPDLVTQINGHTGEKLTKAEIRRRTIRCAQNLTKLGCTQDSCIGVVARNNHNLTPLLYAALCIGAPICPFDISYIKDGLSKNLKRVKISYMFCDAEVLESIKKIASDIGLTIKFITVNESLDGYDSIDSLMKETGEEDSFVCTKIEDAFTHKAIISCSSGSTGLPKSICISHALVHYRLLTTHIFGFRLMTLNFSSMYWISGVFSMLSSAFSVTHIITSKPFSADSFFDFVEKYKVQLFSGPPAHLQSILKSKRLESADLSSLMLCVMTGSCLPPIMIQALKNTIPKCVLLTAYGMTEIFGLVCCTAPSELDEHPNSSGRLVERTKVKIINQKTGEKCGIGEEGEIHVKIPTPPLGYYNDEAATRNAYDCDGYFITADLGYFDESGRLTIIGRKKEIFKSRRYFVFPAELENLILKHPSVQDVCVVSVYDEDLSTELPAAVVIKKEDGLITADEVYAIIADQMADYKRLDGGIYFDNELPVTPSGKIIRAKVKEMARSLYQLKKQSTKN